MLWHTPKMFNMQTCDATPPCRPSVYLFTYLFGDLTGHLFSKVPVLTDSVEQLASLHHLHDYQESRSVNKQQREKIGIKIQCKKNAFMNQLNYKQKNSLPWTGLMWELDTVCINLQDLHYVWMVGTHHVETHLFISHIIQFRTLYRRVFNSDLLWMYRNI